MMIEPRHDKVVVQRLEGEKVTKGGIHLPDTVKDTDKATRGKVVAVGPGKDGEAIALAVGDVILFGKYTGWDVDLVGVKYVVLKDEDVLAVVKEDKS